MKPVFHLQVLFYGPHHIIVGVWQSKIILDAFDVPLFHFYVTCTCGDVKQVILTVQITLSHYLAGSLCIYLNLPVSQFFILLLGCYLDYVNV